MCRQSAEDEDWVESWNLDSIVLRTERKKATLSTGKFSSFLGAALEQTLAFMADHRTNGALESTRHEGNESGCDWGPKRASILYKMQFWCNLIHISLGFQSPSINHHPWRLNKAGIYTWVILDFNKQITLSPYQPTSGYFLAIGQRVITNEFHAI